MPPGSSLAERAINCHRLAQLAAEIKAVYAAFDSADLIRSADRALGSLKLKARIAWTADAIRRQLPKSYPDAISVLLTALPPTPADGGVDSDFGSYKYGPYSQLVATYGCSDIDRAVSLDALRRFTIYCSAEDAVRYFINAFPDETLGELRRWTQDEDHRVRRLASEATRPRLPWSPRIITPAEAAITILDDLAVDDNRFVATSVANHVNDISVTNPELAIALVRKWRAADGQAGAGMAFIANRALRTLVKSGYKPAIELLGYSVSPRVTVSALRLLPGQVRIGEGVTFEFDVTAQAVERLLVDYVLRAPNKAGTGLGTKVFRLKVVTVTPGETIVMSKTHLMKPTSTREVRPGAHRLAVQVNGNRMAEAYFEVVD
jgi:3-methyladenine DNA glycosylase AlkC